MPTLTPSPYTAANVHVTGGAAAINLLTALRAIDPNCSGTATELNLYADDANTGNMFIGGTDVGTADGSFVHYGYKIVPGGSRVYRAGELTVVIPLANLWVYSDAAASGDGVLHVEVIP